MALVITDSQLMAYLICYNIDDLLDWKELADHTGVQKTKVYDRVLVTYTIISCHDANVLTKLPKVAYSQERQCVQALGHYKESMGETLKMEGQEIRSVVEASRGCG